MWKEISDQIILEAGLKAHCPHGETGGRCQIEGVFQVLQANLYLFAYVLAAFSLAIPQGAHNYKMYKGVSHKNYPEIMNTIIK